MRSTGMKNKSVAADFLLQHVNWIERQSKSKVRKVKLDGGGEYQKAERILEADGM